MTYWLLVFLFTQEGEFISKDIYETASMEQCESFAGSYAKSIINTKTMAQFHCVSDDHYMGRKQDKNVPYD
jgi:hypothetical protein